jgi:hypothetical protein
MLTIFSAKKLGRKLEGGTCSPSVFGHAVVSEQPATVVVVDVNGETGIGLVK